MKGKTARPEEHPVPPLNAFTVGVRIVAATLGGYAVAYSLTAALAGVMFRRFGADRVDTAIITTNLALLLWVALCIWCFAERRLWRVVALPVVVTAVCAAVAWMYRL
jgi:biotin transporter BioY